MVIVSTVVVGEVGQLSNIFQTSHRAVLVSLSCIMLGTVAPSVAAQKDNITPLEKQLSAAKQAQESERYLPAERLIRKVVLATDKLLATQDASASKDSSGDSGTGQGAKTPDTKSSVVGQRQSDAKGNAEGDAATSSVSEAGRQIPPTVAPGSAGEQGSVTGTSDSPFLRLAKLADEGYLCLGDCCQKLQKYTEAESAYKKAQEIEEGQALAPKAKAKLASLDEVYRCIKIEQLGDKASDVIKEAGIKNVFAVRNGDAENINVELGARFRRKIDDETAKAATAAAADAGQPAAGSNSSSPSTGGANAPQSNQLKQIRIDPKLSFSLSRQPNGIKLSNIEGLFVDVGLWVKLMEVELLQSEQGTKAKVTGGKFGVQKTVDVNVPTKVYDHVRTNLDKIDPFFSASANQAAAGAAAATVLQETAR